MPSDRISPAERKPRTSEQLKAEIDAAYELEQKQKKMKDEIDRAYEEEQKRKTESVPEQIEPAKEIPSSVDLFQLGRHKYTKEEWEQVQKNIEEAENKKIKLHSEEEKEKRKESLFSMGKAGGANSISNFIYTPEKRKQILKSIYSQEHPSTMEAIFNPPIEEAMQGYEEKGASGVAPGIVKGVRKLFTEDFFNAPLTLDEIRQRAKINEDGTVDVDMADLVRTHLKDSDKLADYAQVFLYNIGKLDHENINALRRLMEIKGSLSEAEPEIKSGKQKVELADAFLGNIPSAYKYREEINNSPLLKRAEDFNVIDESQWPQVRIRMDEATRSNSPVKWKTQLFGTIEIPPRATEKDVQDLAYKNLIIKNVDAITNYARSGTAQDLGGLLNNIGINRVVGWLGKGASLIAPKIMGVLSKAPKTAKILGRAGFEAGLAAEQAELAGTGTREDINTMKAVNAITAGLFSIGGSFVEELTRRSDYVSKDITSRIVKDENALNTVIEAGKHSDLPPEIKAEIPKRLFPEVKELVESYASSIRKLDENTEAYLRTKEVAPDAYQFFNDIMVDENNPQAAKIRENLSAGFWLTNQNSLEATRNEMALRSVLGSGEQVRSTETGPLNPPPVVDPIRKSILKRAADSFGSTEEVVKFLDSFSAGKAYVRPFLETINSPAYQARTFYFHSLQNLLNRTLEANSNTLKANAQAFRSGADFERAMADRFRTPGKVNVAGEFEQKSSIDSVIKESKKDIEKFKINKNSVLIELGKEVHRIVSEKGITNKNSANILLNAVEDLVEGEKLPRDYKNKIVKAYMELGGEEKTIKNPLQQLETIDKLLNVHSQKLSQFMRDRNALDEQRAIKYSPEFAFVRKAGNKIKSKGVFRIESEKLSNSLAGVKNNRQEMTEIMRDFAFLGKTPKGEITTAFVIKAMNQIENRVPVKQLELEIKEALNNPEVSKQISSSERQGLRRLSSALNVFERDIQHYNKALAVSDLQTTSLPEKLTALRRAIDAITNPELVTEIDARMQEFRPDFDSFISDRRMELSPVESQHVWDYLTGDAYTKLKLGSTSFIDLNDASLDSMFKFYNKLGKSTIDEFAQLHFEVFDKPLDRASFHAFYMTPSNNFDSDFVVRGALRKAANEKYEIIQGQDPSKVSAFMRGIRTGEALQAHIAHKTKLSTGSYINYFNDDMRMAKRIYRDLMGGENQEGFGAINFLDMMQKSESYPHMENPTLIKMIKKAFVSEGYIANMNIYNFLENGTVEMTDLGKFLNKIYSDKPLMDKFYKDISDNPDNIEKIKATIESKLNTEFKHKIPEGISEEEVQKHIKAQNKFYADYITNYWNMFDSSDAVPMFYMMWKHLELEAKKEATLFKVRNEIRERQNKMYTNFDGNQVPPLVWRKHRNRNTIYNRRSGLFDANTEILFEDIRVNPLYGTSEYGIADSASDYKLDSIRHPMDNYQHTIKTAIISTGTEHSRAGLSAFVGMSNVLGYTNVSDTLAKYAGLTPEGVLPVEDAQPFMNLLNRAIKKDPGLITRLGLGSFETLNRYVVPFNVLLKPSAVLMNNVQASVAAIIKSDITARKIWNLGTSLISPAYNILLRDKTGAPTPLFKLVKNTDSEAFKIGMEVLARGRDVVQLQHQSSAIRYMQEGVVRNLPITDKIIQFGDKLVSKSNEHIKERIEMYQRADAIDNGLAKHSRIVDSIQSGDVNTAHAMLQNMFPNRAKADIQWQLDNYLKAHKNGNINQALYGMLPMYVDQNIGMFGKQAQSPFLKTVSRIVPGAGLFYSAKNMLYWHFMQLASAAVGSKGEKMKMAGVLMEASLRLGTISLGLTAMGAGVGYPIYEAMFSEKTRGQEQNEAAQLTTDIFLAKIAKNGVFPQMDFSKAIGIETDPRKMGEFFSNYKNILDFAAQITLGTNRSYPIFGYVAEKLYPTVVQGWKAYSLSDMASTTNGNDPIQTIMDNVKTEEELEDLFKAYKLDKNNPVHYDRLVKKVAYTQTYLAPQILDNLFKLSPAGFLTDILDQPFAMYALYSKLKLMKHETAILNQQAKEWSMDKSGVPLDPTTHFKKQSVLPTDEISSEFYKFIGLLDLVEDENFATFVPKYLNLFMEAGLIDKKYAERLRKKHVENFNWETGITEMQEKQRKYGDGKPVVSDELKDFFQGLQKK